VAPGLTKSVCPDVCSAQPQVTGLEELAIGDADLVGRDVAAGRQDVRRVRAARQFQPAADGVVMDVALEVPPDAA
jgi:hypothetical protein